MHISAPSTDSRFHYQMSSIIDAAAKHAVKGVALAAANPKTSLCAAATARGLAVLAAPTMVMTPALTLAGFTANGVAAGMWDLPFFFFFYFTRPYTTLLHSLST